MPISGICRRIPHQHDHDDSESYNRYISVKCDHGHSNIARAGAIAD